MASLPLNLFLFLFVFFAKVTLACTTKLQHFQLNNQSIVQ